MKTEKLATELIKQRTSTRSFDNQVIKDKEFECLKKYIEEINNEIKIKARFTLTIKDKDNKDGQKLGTYGMISGANTFIIGILDKEEKNVVEFGYIFEKIILFATSLNLGTCWLGGTFNKESFENKVVLGENEFIPIVSPVGNKKDKARLIDSLIRASAGANKRKAWEEIFFEGDPAKPLSQAAAGLYSVPLEMVRIGPSASNKQPWRLVKDNNNYHFFLSRTEGYGVATYDLQKNDIGIAKCHFELAANQLSLKGSWVERENIKLENDWEYICTWIENK